MRTYWILGSIFCKRTSGADRVGCQVRQVTGMKLREDCPRAEMNCQANTMLSCALTHRVAAETYYYSLAGDLGHSQMGVLINVQR
jgi:hypothetical protein